MIGSDGVFKNRVMWAANEDGTGASSVCIAELAAGELFFEVDYCGDKRVGGDRSARRIIAGSNIRLRGVGIEAVVTFSKIIPSAARRVDMDDGGLCGVQDHAAGLANVGESKDVTEGVGVVPDGKGGSIEANEISLLGGDKRSALGGESQCVGGVTDVLDLGRVLEDCVTRKSVDEEEMRVKGSIGWGGRAVLVTGVGLTSSLLLAVGSLGVVAARWTIRVAAAATGLVGLVTVAIAIMIIIVPAGGLLLQFLSASEEAVGSLEGDGPLVGATAILRTEFELELFETEVTSIENEVGSKLGLLDGYLGWTATVGNGGGGVGSHACIGQWESMIRGEGDNHFLELVVILHSSAIALL